MPPDLTFATDQEVVAHALAGREDGYREIVRRYQRSVFRLICRMVHQPDLAEDLTQETFIKVFQALGTRRDDSGFATWILGIANHTAVDHLREKRLDTVLLENTPAATPGQRGRAAVLHPAVRSPSLSGRVDARKLAPAIRLAISRLRTKYRRLMFLRYIEERSYENIAEILGLPLGTVKSHIHRGRRDLKEMLRPLVDSAHSGPAQTRV